MRLDAGTKEIIRFQYHDRNMWTLIVNDEAKSTHSIIDARFEVDANGKVLEQWFISPSDRELLNIKDNEVVVTRESCIMLTNNEELHISFVKYDVGKGRFTQVLVLVVKENVGCHISGRYTEVSSNIYDY